MINHFLKVFVSPLLNLRYFPKLWDTITDALEYLMRTSGRIYARCAFLQLMDGVECRFYTFLFVDTKCLYQIKLEVFRIQLSFYIIVSRFLVCKNILLDVGSNGKDLSSSKYKKIIYHSQFIIKYCFSAMFNNKKINVEQKLMDSIMFTKNQFNSFKSVCKCSIFFLSTIFFNFS